MSKIKQLSKNLINQIAAGEVIERPASIVKELVENSIDAGAKRVEIEISNECRDIRIADNGSGINKDDVALAFTRHATSKIETQDDLWNINTLGFRGEALASIISVSKLTCTSRTKDESTGIRVDCSNSEFRTSEAGCAVGTIMDVKDLFYNTPVRKKFLKKESTEFSYIQELVQSIAVSNPNVSIILNNKGKNVLKTSGSGDLATTITEIYTNDLISQLVDVDKSDTRSGFNISGFVSTPQFTRSNKKAIYTFINGRIVKCPIFLKSVDMAYKYLISSDKHPFVVLNLTLPPNFVDVNVHPSKREVRYENPNQIFNFIQYAVKSSIDGQKQNFQGVAVEDEEETFERESHQQFNNRPQFAQNNSYPQTTTTSDFTRFKEAAASSVNLYAPQKTFEPQQEIVSQQRFEINNTSADVENKERIIGQIYDTYILIEKPDGLEVIDQHIAHERTIYEDLKTQKTVASQLLFTSNPIDLEPQQLSKLEESKEILTKYGFDYSVSENSITLKQIPQVLVNKEPEKAVQEILEHIDNISDLENRILISTSCRAAIKAGDKLSIWQMEEIIKNWRKSPYNLTCPHGRRISYTIPKGEIASFFGRVI